MISPSNSNHHVLILSCKKELKKSVLSRPALFLDRDGVLIEDKHYLSNPYDVELIDGASELLYECNKIGIPTIIVTNQSGINRGYYSWNDYEKVTYKLLKLLGKSSLPSAIYGNSLVESNSLESWRKPGIGMLLAAKKDLDIDLNNSILIGDRLSDLIAAHSANLSSVVHVLTGHGLVERSFVKSRFNESKQSFSEDSIFPKLICTHNVKSFLEDHFFSTF